jgi:hypothetical protein
MPPPTLLHYRRTPCARWHPSAYSTPPCATTIELRGSCGLQVIRDLSGAAGIQLTKDEEAIEIKAYEWQQLKEAEALLRLLFRDYSG